MEEFFPEMGNFKEHECTQFKKQTIQNEYAFVKLNNLLVYTICDVFLEFNLKNRKSTRLHTNYFF